MRNPFLKLEPDAVAANTCGVCGSGPLAKHFECRSLDSGYAPIYRCTDCQVLYNATAEFNALDVLEWQKRWSEDPEFYRVPSGKELFEKIDAAKGVFSFFQSALDVKFSGTYVEIGAGSGIMAAAALNYFNQVHALDHVKDRLNKVRAEVTGKFKGDYHVSDFDDLESVTADAILIWHAMEHFLDPGGVFQLCARTLRPSGELLIQVPIISEEHVYPGHYYFYSEATFTKLSEIHGMTVTGFYYDHTMNAMTVSLRKN
jgi:2-polyprenyl-3-methyl-5-hydroxy-6-metoxy-1,4-benzoquinol methylase